MDNLIKVIAEGLCCHPESIVVKCTHNNKLNEDIYHLHVHDDDMGRVIGKGGKISNAIRTIIDSKAKADGTKVKLIIEQLKSRTQACLQYIDVKALDDFF